MAIDKRMTSLIWLRKLGLWNAEKP